MHVLPLLVGAGVRIPAAVTYYVYCLINLAAGRSRAVDFEDIRAWW